MVVALWREELVNRETHFFEHIAGVFGVRAAFLSRHTEIVDRHQHLHVANELNDSEDAQGDQDNLFGIVVHKATAETFTYAYRNARCTAIAAATAVAFFNQSCRQHDRLRNLHRATRHVARRHFLTVTVVGAEFTGEHLNIALAAKENDLFLEYGNAVDQTAA